MMSAPVIAIDGQAASGKGTLARKLADHLNFAYMDTGALYRGVALQCLHQNIDINNKDQIITQAEKFVENYSPEYALNPDLRTDGTGQAASKVAAIPAVRAQLIDLQKNFAAAPNKNQDTEYQGAILDGRDIGTVICPHANAKLFITASLEARAQRRTKELQSRAISTMYDTVLADMRERDTRDAQRQTAPMMAADDALILKTDDLNPDQVFDKAMEFIKSKIPNIA